MRRPADCWVVGSGSRAAVNHELGTRNYGKEVTPVPEEARTLKVGLDADQIIAAVKRMKKADREEFIEDLLAATSPEYLRSVREAREDWRAGRVKDLEEVFGE